jgi:hypothetical protein
MSLLLVDILESFLGEHRKHNEDSGQIAFDCPACSAEKGMLEGDGKGNLEINYNIGKFKCWSCQETNSMYGPVIKLLKLYATPKNIRDYLLVKPDTDLIASKVYADVQLELPEGYQKLSESSHKDYKYGLAMSYLRERGITDEIIKDFDIGYTYRGKFFNRIIIPSYGKDGKLNYFIARWFAKEYTKIKYLNPDAEKQKIIFNELRINWDATIYIVEGATDHIVTPNSIPLLGKYISQELLELLHDKAMANIVIVLDDDAYEDAKFLYKQLNFGNLRGRIKICCPPKGYDPSKIYEKMGAKGIILLLRSSRHLSDIELYTFN